MITIVFENNKIPLYAQLYSAIKREIESGSLKTGEKLPSKRKLALHLKISQITVETAYNQLASEGYIISKARSGFYVQPFDNTLIVPNTNTYTPKNKTISNDYKINFLTNAVDTDCFPFSVWSKLNREILLENKNLLKAINPKGDLGLRESISKYLHQYRGVNIHPEQIIIGAGTEYLLGLIIQIFGTDNIFGVENPCYHKITKILDINKVHTNYIPLDNDGIIIDKLKSTNTNIMYVTPSHHFPLGIVTTIPRRQQIISWANEQDNRFILEDDYDSEFRYSGKPIPALQGLDRNNKVIYFNTFAKTLAPSLRIAYMALPENLLKIYEEKFLFYSCTVPSFEQQILKKFIDRGHFEQHLNKIRNIYKTRRDIVINTFSENNMFDRFSISGEKAGQHLLIQAKNISENVLINAAKNANIKVYGLSEYYSQDINYNTENGTIIIGYSGFKNDELKTAVNKLCKVLKNL